MGVVDLCDILVDCMNGIVIMFGGLIGYVVGYIMIGLVWWKYVFLIFGVWSFVWGFVSFFFFFDLLVIVCFFNEREKVIVIDCVVKNC